MEGSMSLKKRAIEGIVVAGSLVMMSTIAQAADLDGVHIYFTANIPNISYME